MDRTHHIYRLDPAAQVTHGLYTALHQPIAAAPGRVSPRLAPFLVGSAPSQPKRRRAVAGTRTRGTRTRTQRPQR